MRQAIYSITIDGASVTDNFEPHLISLSIKDSEGGKSDSCEIVLDDGDGAIVLPRTGADIEASIGWADGESVTFTGKTDEPHSRGARGQGRTLSITAHSADLKGKGKEPQKRHKDDAKFGDVAKEWGEKAGLTVTVDGDLSDIQRDYWHLDESFFAWGTRIAREIGATFKVSGKKAVFVARGSSKSASGQALASVAAVYGQNVIHWDLTPVYSRFEYKTHKVRWYDKKEAKYKEEQVQVSGASQGAQADLTQRFKATDKDQAKRQAQSNKDEADRGKGGGSISLDGEPRARAQAACTVSGIRAGIDGIYKITNATHTYSRGGGYTTDCELEQPSGEAGQDDRKAAK